MTVSNLKKAISVRGVLMALVMMFMGANGANSQMPQYPLMEQIANKVVAKYQNMSCADLRKSKSTPPSGQQAEMMAKAVAQLKQDPAMRQAFINKVAPPIANKMFDCGMIP